ncbi:bacteriocin [Enterococcus faecalis]|uniref:bacteriocin n=1 Tax=Enterococcus faecalis TaxID=1351 RepID=UPI00359332B1
MNQKIHTKRKAVNSTNKYKELSEKELKQTIGGGWGDFLGRPFRRISSYSYC